MKIQEFAEPPSIPNNDYEYQISSSSRKLNLRQPLTIASVHPRLLDPGGTIGATGRRTKLKPRGVQNEILSKNKTTTYVAKDVETPSSRPSRRPALDTFHRSPRSVSVGFGSCCRIERIRDAQRAETSEG